MRARGRSGFTLVELMVAMALTLFVMVILTQAFSLAVDAFSNAKGVGDMQQLLRAAAVILRDDLQQQHFEGDRKLSDTDMADPRGLVVSQKVQAGFFMVVQPTPPQWNGATTYAPGNSVWSGGFVYNCTAANTNQVPPGAAWLQQTALASTAYTLEGIDPAPASLPSYRAFDHMLYMTVKRIGNRPHNLFTTMVSNTSGVSGVPNNIYMPPTTAYGFYSSQWAEVVYFLSRTGTTEQPNNPNTTAAQTATLGTPLFSLMRAEFVMVPDVTPWNTAFPSASPGPMYTGMSCAGTGATALLMQQLNTPLTFFSPQDSAILGKRVLSPLPTTTLIPQRSVNRTAQNNANFPLLPVGSSARPNAPTTLVMPNVVSFQIRVMPLGSNAFQDLTTTAAGFGTYDTAQMSTASYLNPYGLKAIQITLRIFEPKTRQTRQMTIVQDM